MDTHVSKPTYSYDKRDSADINPYIKSILLKYVHTISASQQF